MPYSLWWKSEFSWRICKSYFCVIQWERHRCTATKSTKHTMRVYLCCFVEFFFFVSLGLRFGSESDAAFCFVYTILRGDTSNRLSDGLVYDCCEQWIHNIWSNRMQRMVDNINADMHLSAIWMQYVSFLCIFSLSIDHKTLTFMRKRDFLALWLDLCCIQFLCVS